MDYSNIITEKLFLGLLTRCKNEFFIKEFAEYYLKQGVNHIIIIDDNSQNKDIYSELNDINNITIIYDKDLFENRTVDKIYKSIRNKFEWLIYVDVDEFIITKKHQDRTIRQEIQKEFQDVDCIKIPWVMMSSNGRETNPKKILHSNVWRWDHDKCHPNTIHKFRCRYEQIEVKCIFRPQKFESIFDHHPIRPISQDIKIVESIKKKPAGLDPFFENLRETSIKEGHLLCYHYRIISRENDINKIQNNRWYNNYTPEDLHKTDYNEIYDNAMSSRVNEKKIFIIGFNRCGTRSLHYFFKKNNLRCVHWDNDNLVHVMNKNLNSPTYHRALQDGMTINENVNSPGRYEEAHVFSDMTFHPQNMDAKDFYKRLDSDYPGSRFILNVRQVEDWISSRKKHSNGYVLKTLMQFHNCSETELEEIWRKMWIETINQITEYFDNRQDDFLLFDIDKHGATELINFLKNDFELNQIYYEWIH